MRKIGIVADDLTGATTVGVLLAKAGITAAAFFDEKKFTETRHQAYILSTDSRALNKEEAQKRVKSAVLLLKEKGAVHFSKRIDTTLRGGIGFEVDAMLEELEEDSIAIMVASMPQSRRIVVGGYSIIDGIPLSKTPVAQDVRTPVTETHIPTLMAQQTKHKIGFVSLSDILSGKDRLKQSFLNQRSDGSKLIIVDAVTLDDVEKIAEAIVELKWSVLAIDPGPFTEKLLKHRGLAQEETEINTEDVNLEEIDGIVLTIAGSATPVTKAQIKTLSNQSWVSTVPVSAEELIDKENTASIEIERVIQKSFETLKSVQPKVLLISTNGNSNRLNLSEKETELGLQPGEAADNINSGLGEIVHQILQRESVDIKGIYMTGGDTMVNILRALGAQGIELIDYVIPQADLGRIIGGKYEGLVIVGKGGLTGTNETAISIVKRIFNEATNRENAPV